MAVSWQLHFSRAATGSVAATILPQVHACNTLKDSVLVISALTGDEKVKLRDSFQIYAMHLEPKGHNCPPS